MVAAALTTLWQDRAARWTALGGFLVMLPIYTVMLPASLTGGRIGWVSLRLISPVMAIIAVALSAVLALTVGLMVLLLRLGRRSSKGAATGGALMALVTPLLCCSPLLPLALGALALAFPALAGVAAGRLQGFIATHELTILLFALGLGVLAFYQNARRVGSGSSCRLPRSP